MSVMQVHVVTLLRVLLLVVCVFVLLCALAPHRLCVEVQKPTVVRHGTNGGDVVTLCDDSGVPKAGAIAGLEITSCEQFKQLYAGEDKKNLAGDSKKLAPLHKKRARTTTTTEKAVQSTLNGKADVEMKENNTVNVFGFPVNVGKLIDLVFAPVQRLLMNKVEKVEKKGELLPTEEEKLEKLSHVLAETNNEKVTKATPEKHLELVSNVVHQMVEHASLFSAVKEEESADGAKKVVEENKENKENKGESLEYKVVTKENVLDAEPITGMAYKRVKRTATGGGKKEKAVTEEKSKVDKLAVTTTHKPEVTTKRDLVPSIYLTLNQAAPPPPKARRNPITYTYCRTMRLSHMLCTPPSENESLSTPSYTSGSPFDMFFYANGCVRPTFASLYIGVLTVVAIMIMIIFLLLVLTAVFGAGVLNFSKLYSVVSCSVPLLAYVALCLHLFDYAAWTGGYSWSCTDYKAIIYPRTGSFYGTILMMLLAMLIMFYHNVAHTTEIYIETYMQQLIVKVENAKKEKKEKKENEEEEATAEKSDSVEESSGTSEVVLVKQSTRDTNAAPTQSTRVNDAVTQTSAGQMSSKCRRIDFARGVVLTQNNQREVQRYGNLYVAPRDEMWKKSCAMEK